MQSSHDATLMVGQSGGPTAVVNATLAGVLRAASRHPKVGRVLGMRYGIAGALQRRLIDLSAFGEAERSILAQTPAAALGSGRYAVRPEDYGRLVDLFRQERVRWFLYIGGNGSMEVCRRLAGEVRSAGLDVQVIGLPKTIDNDLAGTDHAPGYPSAARYIALATMEAGRDLEAMQGFDDVSILEVMGRNTGWLAAAAALGKRADPDAPHLIGLPERPWRVDAFLERVREVHARYGRVFIVLSEGIRDEAGRLLGATGAVPRDPLGRQVATLSAGPGQFLAERIRNRLGLQARVNRPGTLQRSALASAAPVDLAEAGQVGEAGVRLAMEGASGVMVSIRRRSDAPYEVGIDAVPLERAAGVERVLPDAYIRQDGLGVTEAFLTYARPLVGELPHYVRLEDV